ncbi:peptidoglycan-binding domain-containing protein [Streptomyces sp. T028]|uniref:peptidoglycan-binding domain-containing protein n=1 Tax=Streptomyces sp. T028 TaxID=3394379 RepID=UPI003A852EF1
MIALALALATAWGVVTASGTGSALGGGAADGERLLFSTACTGPLSMGRRGTCVREVQRLLRRAGAEVDIDGEFGPQTLRRVTAFQVLSRIGADGVVDEETKKALYAPGIRMDTWAREKVGQRVREVFGGAAERAVAVAVCQSSLDPLHIVSNADGTRNWGVFQLSDIALRKSGGTPRDAVDPEWNIQAAHRLWSRTKDFRAWPYCDGAASPEAVEPGSVKTSDGRLVPPTQSASSAACPAPGQRFKLAAHNRVYLVGPGSSLYYIPDETVYFNLWDSWDGVVTLSGEVFVDCNWPKAYALTGAFLARTGSGARIYIWDAWYGYRLIPDGRAFDAYGFSRPKIQTRSSLSPADSDRRWQ